jgi:hypothetical protein
MNVSLTTARIIPKNLDSSTNDHSNIYNMFVQLVVHLHSKKDEFHAHKLTTL